MPIAQKLLNVDRCTVSVIVLFRHYLKRPGSVRLLPAEVDLACNGQSHEEPVAKAVVVDELENILYCQVDQ